MVGCAHNDCLPAAVPFNLLHTGAETNIHSYAMSYALTHPKIYSAAYTWLTS